MKIRVALVCMLLPVCSEGAAASLNTKTLGVLGQDTRIVTRYKSPFRMHHLLYSKTQNLYAYVAQSLKDPADVGGCVIRPENQALVMRRWIK